MMHNLITPEGFLLDAVLCLVSKLFLETIFLSIPESVIVFMALGSSGCIGLLPLMYNTPWTRINLNRTLGKLYFVYAICVKHLHIMISLLLFNNLYPILPYNNKTIVIHSFLLIIAYMYNYLDRL